MPSGADYIHAVYTLPPEAIVDVILSDVQIKEMYFIPASPNAHLEEV